MLVELLLEKVQNLCSFFQITGRMACAPIFVWGIQTLATRELVKRSTFIKSAKIMLVFPNYAKTYASTIDKGLPPRVK